MPERMSWDEAKALDEANREAERNKERDKLLLAIGAMAVRASDHTLDCCLYCLAEGTEEDPHDWDCPERLIDQFHEKGFTLPPARRPTGEAPDA